MTAPTRTRTNPARATAPTRSAPTRSAPTRSAPNRANPRRSAPANPAKPRRSPAAPRPRSAAATKAYAKRAHRSEKLLARGGRTAQQRRTSTHASTASFVVLLMIMLVGGIATTLWLSTQSTADSYRLEQIKATTNSLAQRREMLQEQVAKAESATSLAARAQQLGMVPATDPAHLVVGADGKVTVVGKPSPATAAPDGQRAPAADQPPPPNGQQQTQPQQQPTGQQQTQAQADAQQPQG